MKLFKRPPAIEFNDVQRQQLFAHARDFLWNCLLLSALVAGFLFLSGDGLLLVLLKVPFVLVTLMASLGMQVIWPKRAESNLTMWLTGKAMSAATTSCLFLVMMVNPDKSVNNLLLMFGVFFTVIFLFSLAGWGYDEPRSARCELPLSRENEFQLK